MRFLVLLILLPLGAAAETPGYTQRLSRARSAREITELRRQYEELKIARGACKLQLRSKSVPVACYETLTLEKKWGLHPRAAGRENLRARLDEMCARAAHELRVTVPVEPGSPVSPACRKEIARALAIREYRDKDPGWSGN